MLTVSNNNNEKTNQTLHQKTRKYLKKTQKIVAENR